MEVKVDIGNLKLDGNQGYVIQKKVNRIERLCRMFRSNLVSIQVRVGYNNLREGFEFHLKLAVPHRQIVAVGRNKKFSLAAGEAFNKVISQFRKYRAKLKKKGSFAKVTREKGKA